VPHFIAAAATSLAFLPLQKTNHSLLIFEQVIIAKNHHTPPLLGLSVPRFLLKLVWSRSFSRSLQVVHIHFLLFFSICMQSNSWLQV